MAFPSEQGKTFGFSGKNGRIVVGAAQDLHLTKFVFRAKTDSTEVTNNRSPVMKVTNASGSQYMLAEEVIPTIFMGELEYEGVYTIEESATGPTYTGLMFSSGTILPGFGDKGPFGGLYTMVFKPDYINFGTTELIQGVFNIETFEITGETKGGVTFKGTAKLSGGLYDASATDFDFTTTSNKL